MKPGLERSEIILASACGLLLLLATFGPSLAQPAHYHAFADQRSMWGVPCAGDVLSNLPFGAWGCAGLLALWRLPRAALDAAQLRMSGLFFAGLLFTAAGSVWYHWSPQDAGLAVDRLGMVVAFAGLLGLAAAGRISARAGMFLAASLLLLGPLSVYVWASNANVLPWAVLQFGGLALLLWLARRVPLAGALAVHWWQVIALYAVAKCLEQGDHQVYELLGQLVSGHSLKHLVASLAAWPVWAAVARFPNSRQNPAEIMTTARAPAMPCTRQ